MGLDKPNIKFTPADKAPLHKDECEPPCVEEWNYRSVVSITVYLEGSKRPDIAYAFHQCTRFSHKPRLSYESSLKYIGRYLKGARTTGIIMWPDIFHMNMNLYADADFAGMFAAEDKSDHIRVKSRTEILLCFGNVPIF